MTDTTAPETPDEAEPEIPVLDAEQVPEFGKPTYLVVGNHFIAQTELGEFRFPMTFKTKLVRSMPADIQIGDLLDQLYWLLENEPDEHLRSQYQALTATLDDLDINESRRLASKLFQAFAEKQRARLGESGRSSRS